jgi:hypothetical protein
MSVLDDLRRGYAASFVHAMKDDAPAPAARRAVEGPPFKNPNPFDPFGRGVEEPKPQQTGKIMRNNAPQWRGFEGDELAECKAVIAGLLAKTEGLNGQLEQWQAALAARDETILGLYRERDELAAELARACATRDRYQANGKRVLAQNREMESILKFPGVPEALTKALHPDTGKGGDMRARTAIFQALMPVLVRLGIRAR